ncbi:MAG TPA: AtpZ/AtpI family protein [Methanotrichaceae archaeon]|nr:AtpZ/AtpI family protein [Methanotrichaceae archaeon]
MADLHDEPGDVPGMEPGEMTSERPGADTDEMTSEKTGSGMEPVMFHDGAFARKVGLKEDRKIKARKERGKGIWFGLGTMGMIGWSVAVPTLIGVALGAWLDSRYPGQISWTLTFLSIGLAIGCANAWYWVRREQKGISGGEGRD